MRRLGPIGANGLAQARDFLHPVARYEDVEGAFTLVAKFHGRLWAAPIGHSPLDVVAWHGNYAPYKYDLRRFNALGSISFDHPDPSIFSVLQAASDTPGVASFELVVFPPRILCMADTFRPPWFHRNCASEFMGLITGEYDARRAGFEPGGASLHNSMAGHGPDAATFLRASAADLSAPDVISGSLAFMIEARAPLRTSARAGHGRAPAPLRPVLGRPAQALRSHEGPMNETHDPALRSFVPSACLPDADFPLQNLPYGVFRRRGSGEAFRGGVAIGDQIVDLAALARAGLLSGRAAEACEACVAPALSAFFALGPAAWSALRLALSRALRGDSAVQAQLTACLVPQAQAEHTLPMVVGDYTDFYASIHHAERVGALFRPDQPLLPNYRHVPIAYHGRSSSLLISGTPVQRPWGQVLPAGESVPRVQPSARLDYELELGVVVGQGNALGEPVPMAEAEAHVFGLCLLNDWSARDIQGWEYQPLGPFAGKNFATTLSPWLVSLEALAPFRAPFARRAGEPVPLPHLASPENSGHGALGIAVEARLQTAAMRARGEPARRLAQSNFRDSYWTIAQMLSHHTLNGCPLRAGDVLGTGTISGPERAEGGCLLELSVGGKQPITLADGETRSFLEDGDQLELYAHCAREGAVRIGFGTASGLVVSARGAG
ncbi:MAG: hypothetical protein RL385_2210 [Pseudomonadota bacterium]